MKNVYFMFLIGFLISIIIAPAVISIIRKLKAGQNILEYVDVHASKQGTPTMGGIIFIIGLIVCFFIIFDDNCRLSSILILVTLAYATLGFLDDFLKIKFRHNEGLKAYQKATGQFGIAIIVAFFVYNTELVSNSVLLPFGLGEINLGVWIIPFIVIFFLAVTNSVNLTDGLDGLAGGVSGIFFIGFILLINRIIDMGLLSNIHVLEFQNISLVVASFIGCVLAFLCYNFHPAKVFMGDTGSLAIGGFVACVLTFTNTYLVVFLSGIMFVVNTVSVVMQVGYYKLTKKRIFKMAPLHHHFEKCGAKETKVVFIYYAITLIGVALSMLIFV